MPSSFIWVQVTFSIRGKKKGIKKQFLFVSDCRKTDYMYSTQFKAHVFIIHFYSEGAIFDNLSCFSYMFALSSSEIIALSIAEITH